MKHEMSINGVKWSVTIHIDEDTVSLRQAELLLVLDLS